MGCVLSFLRGVHFPRLSLATHPLRVGQENTVNDDIIVSPNKELGRSAALATRTLTNKEGP